MCKLNKSKTEIVREEMREYLKTLEGKKIRQVDLTKYMLANSSVASEGIVRGIYNRMLGIGGSYKLIPNVKIVSEDGKSFLYYEESEFNDASIISKLKQKNIEFETSLKQAGLWNVSILDLPFEERQPYFEYMENFEKLRNMFVKKGN